LNKAIALFFILAGINGIASPSFAADAHQHRARTLYHVRHKRGTTIPDVTQGWSGYSPTQVRHAYGIDQYTQTGSSQIIAIVDAYDNPNAAADLQIFISTFGLQQMYGLPGTAPCTVYAGPHPCFQKSFPGGSAPIPDGGWSGEESLDVQWAHAIAPGADILLVEAASNNYSDLFPAVQAAANSGAQAVSMSWTGGDFSAETSYDSIFSSASGVFFTASSGDAGDGVNYPAASPYVLAVGGTSLTLDAAGNIISDVAWSGSGGGISAYESEPQYQYNYGITSTGGMRAVPDVSYDADPNTGVPVYASYEYGGWVQFGGTSAGAPQWAAIAALADQGSSAPLSGNQIIYQLATGATSYAANFIDITSGSNGSCGANCRAGHGAAKAAVNLLGESLAQELSRTDIKVTTVCPGTTDTNFIDSSVYSNCPPRRKIHRGQPPEQAARAIIRAICADRRHLTLTAKARAITVLNRISRNLADKVVCMVKDDEIAALTKASRDFVEKSRTSGHD
jgi:subtilase family serine protease